MLSLPAPAADARRARLSSPERKREIVTAFIELAREHGPEAITTQAIATRVGLTHGALFRHFPDKHAMWSAVLDWVQARLEAMLDEVFRVEGRPVATLERLFVAHVNFVTGYPGVPRILLHELQRPAQSEFHARVRSMVGAYRSRLVDLLGRARLAGELPASLDVNAAAMLFLGTVQGVAIQSILFPGETGTGKSAKKLFGLLLDGFRGVRP